MRELLEPALLCSDERVVREGTMVKFGSNLCFSSAGFPFLYHREGSTNSRATILRYFGKPDFGLGLVAQNYPEKTKNNNEKKRMDAVLGGKLKRRLLTQPRPIQHELGKWNNLSLVASNRFFTVVIYGTSHANDSRHGGGGDFSLRVAVLP